MKKIILSLLALSSIVSADLVVLKCSFTGLKDGTIKINQPSDGISRISTSSFRLPTCNLWDTGSVKTRIDSESINISEGGCFIDIRRDTGAIEIRSWSGKEKEVFKGMCTKESNAI